MDDMNDLNDYDRGEYDRIAGYDALPNQSDAYEQSYGKAYNLEMNATARSEQ